MLFRSEIYDLFDVSVFLRFINSDIYEEMKNAFANNRLYRERQFIITMPADRIIKDGDKEPILMQGIMDAYYEDDDGIVLIDYKSDIIKSMDELKDKYEIQLDIYKYTLEKLYKKEVKAFIYSTRFGKCIEIS